MSKKEPYSNFLNGDRGDEDHRCFFFFFFLFMSVSLTPTTEYKLRVWVKHHCNCSSQPNYIINISSQKVWNLKKKKKKITMQKKKEKKKASFVQWGGKIAWRVWAELRSILRIRRAFWIQAACFSAYPSVNLSPLTRCNSVFTGNTTPTSAFVYRANFPSPCSPLFRSLSLFLCALHLFPFP